ncbi:hypothetical protein [Rhodohalobacter sp. SW132]|uniref:hypothetical protein n=2 Tax=Rhodohalobacter sp. SW132 TaxID=2293433 RepID=UPI001AE01C04|nr:hypothetical protein [Rhodohalobacter sp. SW132]
MRSPLSFLCILMFVILFYGCSDISQKQIVLHQTEHEISTNEGEILLQIDDIPSMVQVDAEVEFGASERFTEAVMQPQGEWFAVTTAGISHGAGWLVDRDQNQIYPAAFQYGGSVEAGPWSESGEFAVFINIGPAPSQTLSVATMSQPGRTVNENSMNVRISDHSGSVPPESVYEPIRWDDEMLVFEVDGIRYKFDPVDNEVTAQD